MLEDSNRLWWDEITGPASLVREIANNLQNANSVLLYVPDDLPWRKQMRSSVERVLRESDPDLLVDYVDCKTDYVLDAKGDINISEFLLNRYAYPDIKSGYRVSSRISIQKYILEKKVLQNRIIWVKGMTRQHIQSWLVFCKDYKSKSRYDGLFVIESYGELLTHSAVSCMKTLFYRDFVTYYDALLFNNMLLSSTHQSLEWMQYISTVASLLCKRDVELSESLIERSDFTKVSPIESLQSIAEDSYYENRFEAEHLDTQHPFALIRAGKSDEMQHMVWQAQLQVMFPLVESERITFIEKYYTNIKEALAAEYFDYNKYANFYITQFGERVDDPYDVDIGTIYRMNHLRKASDISLYMLFLPNEDDRQRLELLHDMRNSIAHVEACTIEQTAKFLSDYPYNW